MPNSLSSPSLRVRSGSTATNAPVRLALPKGRMQDGVLKLLIDSGVDVTVSGRTYRPRLAMAGFDTKLLKPQNAIEMLKAGSRDLGFAGADWARELGADLVEVLDTGLNPVRVVVAAPDARIQDGRLTAPSGGRLRIASEYERLTRGWIADQGLDATFVRAYGATEVFPPEDADAIVDNTATGATLNANALTVCGEVMQSSTRLFASRAAMDQPDKRDRIEHLALLLRSVLEARKRVLLEVNVDAERLAALVDALPCMREPTVSSLAGGAAFAVRAAVPRAAVAELVPLLKAAGGTDLLVSPVAQIVP